ncbi:MAG: GDSL-type esterase/lipase family protein [Actinomycetaceae bacterium]|nr:GDSL-type esterase/lipase family protein [Actinomycetaceae bacterium]
MNVFFIGDELVAGYGDARALGWTGRVLARTSNEPPLMAMTLAVPHEDTSALARRWADEVSRRMSPDEENKLVIGLGSHDLDSGQTLARARLHLANVLDAAQRLRLRAFVVGPPPRRDHPRKIQQDLTHAFADVCSRRDLPYVDTFTPLVDHEQWNTDMTISGGYEPRQAGYGLMAWLVLHNGWNEWLGVGPATSK